jgi:hypothetical protein
MTPLGIRPTVLVNRKWQMTDGKWPMTYPREYVPRFLSIGFHPVAWAPPTKIQWWAVAAGTNDQQDIAIASTEARANVRVERI